MEDKQTIQPTKNDIELPLATEDGGVLTSRAFVTGKSGSGKSNTVGVICEQILDQSLPLMVIDTEGEYYGLKEQYELLHVGATEECDLQVTVDHAEKLAELALEQNVPIILDISGFIDEDEANQLIEQTLRHLFQKEQKLKKPFPVVLEEAHNYIPQQGKSDLSEIVIKIGKQGRKRGLGIMAVSQRPADVKKSFITQCDWRIWHYFDYNNDLDVAKDILGKEYADRIADFEPGEAILECDFIEEDKIEVKFKRKQTFDAGATPTLDEDDKPELKSLDEGLIDELQQISERKRKERSRIEELEEKLEEEKERNEELEKDLERAREVQELGQQLVDAVREGGSDEQVAERLDDIKEKKNKRIHELETQLEEEEERNQELAEELKSYKKQVEELEEFREYQEMAEQLEDKKEMAEEAIQRLADVFDLDMDGSKNEKAKKQLKQKKNEIEKLQSRIDSLESKKDASVKEHRFDEAAEFLENEKVKEFVGKAAGSTTLAEKHYWDAVTFIAQNGEASSSELDPLLEVAKTNINKILKALEDHKVLNSKQDGKSKVYTLNKDGVSEILELHERRKNLREKREELKPAESS